MAEGALKRCIVAIGYSKRGCKRGGDWVGGDASAFAESRRRATGCCGAILYSLSLVGAVNAWVAAGSTCWLAPCPDQEHYDDWACSATWAACIFHKKKKQKKKVSVVEQSPECSGREYVIVQEKEVGRGKEKGTLGICVRLGCLRVGGW
jgi:hypothetical protein